MALRVKYKDVLWEMPLAAKVFNRKKYLILDAGNAMAAPQKKIQWLRPL
jgi:hypothetical protein